MYKHVSAGVVDVEYSSLAIKERNIYLKDGKFSVLDGGICSVGDIIVCGPDYESAAEYLKSFLLKCTDINDHVKQLVLTEELYDVQVWDTSDFNLERVLSL